MAISIYNPIHAFEKIDVVVTPRRGSKYHMMRMESCGRDGCVPMSV